MRPVDAGVVFEDLRQGQRRQVRSRPEIVQESADGSNESGGEDPVQVVTDDGHLLRHFRSEVVGHGFVDAFEGDGLAGKVELGRLQRIRVQVDRPAVEPGGKGVCRGRPAPRP